jgi:hypothetical protein
MPNALLFPYRFMTDWPSNERTVEVTQYRQRTKPVDHL